MGGYLAEETERKKGTPLPLTLLNWSQKITPPAPSEMTETGRLIRANVPGPPLPTSPWYAEVVPATVETIPAASTCRTMLRVWSGK